ncbi:High mobility group [Stylosanthes scabra]|uniref:High mobility group n=1 Tax=Stylosanthes scabra TaxID=79078 RepID=A0ABU6SDD4_9FABA|nr:High mobility group [Stylosanthes scabra]
MPKVKSNVKAADNRLSRKDVGIGTKQAKKKAAAKDPNKPKRPPSAFFVFMSDFREEYKKENPNNKSVAVVGKAGGARWKSMSDAEKAPYHAKAEKSKLAYEEDVRAYTKGLDEGGYSDKSKSEVHDYDDDEEEDE